MFVFKKCKTSSARSWQRFNGAPGASRPTNKHGAIIKAKGKKAALLKKLRAFLDAEEPQTAQWLVSFWDKQSATVTYKELREAYLAGGITPAQLDKWQKQYANFVNTALAPQWYKAIEAAANEAKAQFPYFLYEPSIAAAQAYVRERASSLVTMLAQEQKDALNAMIAQASGYGATSADELARIMRPVIGLTKPQAAANLKYYEAVKTGLKEANPNMKPATAEAKAREAAAKYAAKQHRYRAQNIARTELAMAYNEGHDGAIRDAIERGYIGDCKKTWLTAADEGVCPICSAIDGESVNMNDTFSVGVKIPPAHPSCRCAVAYEEIAPPVLTSQPDYGIMGLSGAPETQETQLNEFISLIDALPDMSDEYKAALISRFQDGTDEAKELYLKYVNADSVADGKNKSAYYQPSTQKIHMNFQNDLKDGRGAGNTFFHEHGHYIDYNSRQSRIDPATSRKMPEFGEAIMRDLRSLEQKTKTQYGVKSKAATYDRIKKDILSAYSREDVNGISDIIEGAKKIPYPMGYGHGVSYWKSTPVEIEAFAHMYAAQFDAVKAKAMQEYLPKAWAEFTNLMKGLL